MSRDQGNWQPVPTPLERIVDMSEIRARASLTTRFGLPFGFDW
jgi:hypothetical protein